MDKRVYIWDTEHDHNIFQLETFVSLILCSVLECAALSTFQKSISWDVTENPCLNAQLPRKSVERFC